MAELPKLIAERPLQPQTSGRGLNIPSVPVPRVAMPGGILDSLPLPRVDAETFGASVGESLARAGHEIRRESLSLADALLDAQSKRQKAESDAAAAEITQRAQDEFLTKLPEVRAVPPTQMLPRFHELKGEVVSRAVDLASTPEQRKYILEHLRPFFIQHLEKVSGEYAERLTATITGALDQSVASQSRLAVGASTPEAAERIFERISNDIDDTFTLNDEQKTKRKDEVQKLIFEGRAFEEMRRDPQAFLDEQRIEKYRPHVAPKFPGEVEKAAEELVKARDVERVRRLTYQREGEERAAKQLSQGVRSALEDRIIENDRLPDGQRRAYVDLQDEVSTYRRELSAEDFTHLNTLVRTLENADETRPSEVPVLTEVYTKLAQFFTTGRETIAPGDLARLAEDRKLSRADYREAVSAHRAIQQHHEAQGTADRNYLRAQGEQVLRANLGQAGLLNLDKPEAQSIFAAALAEYTLTLTTHPEINPITLSNELTGPGGRYRRAFERAFGVSLGVDVHQAIMRYKTREEVAQAFARGDLSRALADFYISQFEALKAPTIPDKPGGATPTDTPTDSRLQRFLDTLRSFVGGSGGGGIKKTKK